MTLRIGLLTLVLAVTALPQAPALSVFGTYEPAETMLARLRLLLTIEYFSTGVVCLHASDQLTHLLPLEHSPLLAESSGFQREFMVHDEERWEIADHR